MLFALIGFYRKGAESHLLEISGEINEYLGQSISPPRLAGVLRGRNGEHLGNLMLIEAAGFEQAEARLNDSPALNAGLYHRAQVAQFDIEIGDLTAD
jgi:hypothetical protein